MGQIITSATYPRMLLGDLGIVFGAHYKQLKAMFAEIYKRKASKRNYEEALQITGMGTAEIKGEGEAITLDGTSQGFGRRTTHTVWQKSAKITMEALDDNLHLNQANELGKHLARALYYAKETNAAALFNNATSTSAPYLGGDAKALLASDHPLAGGGTSSNIVSADLSELALVNAMIALAGWVDNSGLLIDADVKCLLLPKESRYIAHRILQSSKQVNSAENNTNALKDRSDIPDVKEWRFLTDSDSWFLLTDQDGLCHYDRMAAKPSYEQEHLTKDHIYTIMERYSFDYYDWRSVYGSVGV